MMSHQQKVKAAEEKYTGIAPVDPKPLPNRTGTYAYPSPPVDKSVTSDLETGTPGSVEKTKGSKKKAIIIVLAVLLVVAAIVGGVIAFITIKNRKEAKVKPKK